MRIFKNWEIINLTLFVLIFSFGVLVTDIYACSDPGQPPVHGFTINGDECVGTNKSFSAITSGFTDSVTYYWSFGDGTFDTLVPPGFNYITSHMYSVAGQYPISLIKINDHGVDTTYDTLTITNPPTADFSISDDTLCANQSFSFIDLSVGGDSAITSWSWDFGDGATSTNINPSHIYNVAGQKKAIINLTVAHSNGCASTYTDSVSIKEDTSLARFSFAAGCACNNVSLTNTTSTSTSWLWDFGDNTFSSLENPTYAYTKPGDYYITQTGYDNSGCSFSKIQTITVCPNDVYKDTSKSNSRWYFQMNAGVNFNTTTPTALTNGATTFGSEGSATISEPNTGNLLFYSDGFNIYDSTHNIMPNGDTLLGCTNDIQGILIVPNPANINQYYVFTNNGASCGGMDVLHYSLVDMSLNGGLGDVVIGQKNILLSYTHGSEALSGTIKKARTCNSNAEYWVVIQSASDTFKSFLVSEVGIATPVISNIGNGGDFLADMTFSQNGDKIVVSEYAASWGKGFALYDFDINTGVLSNVKFIDGGYATPGSYPYMYGIAFSPNGKLVYAGTRAPGNMKLYQYDITSTDITASRQTITTFGGGSGLGVMFIGPDDKLYIARESQPWVGVVNNPNVYGVGCNYVANGISLAGKTSRNGLQNIIPLNLTDPIKLNASFDIDPIICPTYQIAFSDTSCNFKYDSLLTIWDYGDGIIDSFDVLTYPTHTYANPDTYTVALVIIKDCFTSDTAFTTFILDSIPEVIASSDTVCLGDSTQFLSTIFRIDSVQSYLWSGVINSSVANPLIPLSSAGTLTAYLMVTDTVSCSYLDTLSVIVNPLPSAINLDTTLCRGEVLQVSSGIGNSFLWTPNKFISSATLSNPFLNIDSNISYMVFADNGLCPTDTGIVNITVNPLPIVSTIKDTTIDLGDEVILTTIGGLTYVWSPTIYLNNSNISNPTSATISTTEYIVVGSDINGCSASDTVLITVEVKEDFYVPNAFTPNGESNNDKFMVRGLQGEKTFNMKVYDRWGNKVFESKDKNEAWLGTLNNESKNLNAGVFVYIINATLLNDIEIEKTGNVTLLK